jgi:hypothetical protein
MFEARPKNKELFVAAAALYKTLFNMKTSAPNLSSAIHVDTLCTPDPSNIVATFDYINLIGWKYHEK